MKIDIISLIITDRRLAGIGKFLHVATDRIHCPTQSTFYVSGFIVRPS